MQTLLLLIFNCADAAHRVPYWKSSFFEDLKCYVWALSLEPFREAFLGWVCLSQGNVQFLGFALSGGGGSVLTCEACSVLGMLPSSNQRPPEAVRARAGRPGAAATSLADPPAPPAARGGDCGGGRSRAVRGPADGRGKGAMTPGGRRGEAKEERRWARGEAGKEGGGGNPDAALGWRRGVPRTCGADGPPPFPPAPPSPEWENDALGKIHASIHERGVSPW